MVTIGLLIPQEGPPGIWAPSAEACATLAVHELNGTGGLFGREVRLAVVDAGPTARSAAAAATSALEIDGVDAIVGMIPSYARRAIVQAIGGRIPFVYTPQFEGDDPDCLTVGETSDDLLVPGIAHLSQALGARRFFLVGDDYVWPRGTFRTAKPIIRAHGGTVVGEMLLPFGFADYDRIFDAIRVSGADVVLPYFLGAGAISFNRAFAEAGLAARVLRFCSAIDETVLYGLGEDATENLFLSSAYFSSIRSHNNGGFLERYHGLFGDCPPPANAFGQSCYEGIHCLAGLVQAAGAFDVSDIRRRMRRTFQASTARGVDRQPVAGARHPIHFARVEGCDVRIMGPQ
ncbi:nitrile hydratase regulator [Aureimonas sp. SA4125]|uniref:substrate-binding domain-containing protein n=1 Tax=Aureimonas sp. SA4125 TaxID=2826993 RepID=UPI001CC67D44|nr:substrate-binding domain-containing protein [Aureimonas sp. SA4125]BDA85192.1 nitrile hydratase regulator [Aureimonas sp. SA4125]